MKKGGAQHMERKEYVMGLRKRGGVKGSMGQGH